VWKAAVSAFLVVDYYKIKYLERTPTTKDFLVGAFNPSEKYQSNCSSFPKIRVNIKTI